MPRVCALLTCFDRRDTTLACLQALAESFAHAGVAPQAVLVDDGSRDGTAAAVQAHFAWVQLLRGDGSLYWCRGMHRAMAQALPQGFDHLLWLNDDTLLRPAALATLLATAQDLQRHEPQRNDVRPLILVGSTCDGIGDDGQTGAPTYGGRWRPSAWRPTRFALRPPAAQPQAIDTFDGNIVLVSAAAAQAVGNLDAAFEHAMGDTDYGLRAGRAGVALWLAPGFQGTCRGNPRAGGFADASLPLRQRWRLMMHRKGLPWRSWWRFTRRHAGVAWPLWFAWPYLRVLGQGAVLRLVRLVRPARAAPRG